MQDGDCAEKQIIRFCILSGFQSSYEICALPGRI